MERRMHEGFRAIGLSAKVRNDDPAAVGGLWEKFQQSNILAMLPAGTDPKLHCIYHAYAGNFLDPYEMTIGYVVAAGTAPPKGLSAVDVPAQPVALFETVGDQPATLLTQWQSIWKSDLDRAYVADFDVYDPTQPNHVTVVVGLKAADARHSEAPRRPAKA